MISLVYFAPSLPLFFFFWVVLLGLNPQFLEAAYMERRYYVSIFLIFVIGCVCIKFLSALILKY